MHFEDEFDDALVDWENMVSAVDDFEEDAVVYVDFHSVVDGIFLHFVADGAAHDTAAVNVASAENYQEVGIGAAMIQPALDDSFVAAFGHHVHFLEHTLIEGHSSI